LEQYVGSWPGLKVVKITTLGGEKALVAIPSKPVAGEYLGEFLFVAKNKFIFEITAGFETKTDIYREFGEILSTFKFFEPSRVNSDDCC
jgi:hypothetical protein